MITIQGLQTLVDRINARPHMITSRRGKMAVYYDDIFVSARTDDMKLELVTRAGDVRVVPFSDISRVDVMSGGFLRIMTLFEADIQVAQGYFESGTKELDGIVLRPERPQR